MAKRKTIGENPLDTLVPDRPVRQQEQTTATTHPQPAVPLQSAAPRRPARSASVATKSEKETGTAVPTTRTQSPPQQDLLSRIKSLEDQNEFIKWLVGGTILLAIML